VRKKAVQEPKKLLEVVGPGNIQSSGLKGGFERLLPGLLAMEANNLNWYFSHGGIEMLRGFEIVGGQ
jgi:hypothetical protein